LSRRYRFLPRVLCLGLLLGLGCGRGGEWVTPLDVPGTPRTTPEVEDPTAIGSAPWQIAATDLHTQRLYRVRLESRKPDQKGQNGDRGRFKLTLRLATPSLYQLNAVDPLGRGLWTLHVDGDQGLLVDYRDRRACSYGGDVDLTNLQLGPFPMRRLPAAILGRLPVEPSPGGAIRRRGSTVEVLDRAARRWTATVEGAQILDWRLDPPDGGPGVHYTLEPGGWRRLVDPREGLTLEWREIVVEGSAAPPTPPQIPEKFARGGCAAADAVAPTKASPSNR